MSDEEPTTPEPTTPYPFSEASYVALGYTTLDSLFQEFVADSYGPTVPVMIFPPTCLSSDLDNLIKVLQKIRAINNIPNEPLQGKSFDGCKPPTIEVPTFSILLRNPLSICVLPLKQETKPNPNPPPPTIEQPLNKVYVGCVGLEFDASTGLDIRYEQKWNFISLKLGDLSSTMSLAPAEQLTLEFQTTQRRLLEQTRVDSVEEMFSTETITQDKEVLNVTRASSKTDNWRVDGTGHFIFDGGWADLGGGISSR